MRFPDKVKLKVISWDGWNGCVSWRREKYIAFWWPDGWDGGKWGDIYFVWDEWASSLLKLHYQKQIKAKKWEHGRGSQEYGKNADDVFVPVPLWTTIKDINTQEILWTILEHWQKILVAKWWRWGRWNIHFKNDVKQYPNFAMYGEPWEKKELELELQLIWDVTLIWFPSVGKSSIINTLANTKAKVADYNFTTLIPNLWVVKYKNKDFVLVDVPWLIQWASSWKGLGNEFLRHILKSRIWTFTLDISRYEQSLQELTALKKELEKFLTDKLVDEFPKIIKDKSLFHIDYKNFDDDSLQIEVFYDDKLLFTKFVVFLVNKKDLVSDEEIIIEYEKVLKYHIRNLFKIKKSPNIDFVYAGNKNIFEDYLHEVVELLKQKINQDTIFDDYILPKEEILVQKRQKYIKNITEKEIPYLLENEYIDEQKAEIIQVHEVFNKKLAYYTYIIPWGNKEAEMLFFDVMKSEGISKELENNGVMIWDIIKVKSPYAWVTDRYLEWKLG